ncbi:hypothetical protein ACVCIC_28775 [Burkholderia glumae]|uniref:hypothetical protein n=1 Tax=Burkholderia TaxID=32008 RepID=UPI001BB69200|nr:MULTISPECIES: hypothetical protein [Burkholderia]QKM52873.1 hypothetical protein CG017_00867 [Burkholderia glumae]QTP34459.1 hypothetical protein B7759_03068 [Burkholderia glumae]
MNPSLHTAALAGTGLAIVAALSVIAWLVMRRRASQSPVVPPPACAARINPPSAFDDGDDREAFAPYPDHALHAAHSFASALTPEPAHERRTGSHDEAAFEPPLPDTEDRPPPVRDTPADPDSTFSPFFPGPGSGANSSTAAASARCPHCDSTRIDTLDLGRRTGGTIGSVAGATGGFAMALSGAEAGAAVGAIGGPVGSILGGLAGAVIAGLLGGAAGGAAGSAVGAAIDDNLLPNYRCRSCGQVFGSYVH